MQIAPSAISGMRMFNDNCGDQEGFPVGVFEVFGVPAFGVPALAGGWSTDEHG